MKELTELRLRVSKRILDRVKQQADIETAAIDRSVTISDIIETALEWYFGSSLFEKEEGNIAKILPKIEPKVEGVTPKIVERQMTLEEAQDLKRRIDLGLPLLDDNEDEEIELDQ